MTAVPCNDFVVIEVPAVIAGRARCGSEISSRSHADTPEHRPGRKLHRVYAAGRLAQTDCLPLEVQIPRHDVDAFLDDLARLVAVRIDAFDRFGRERVQPEAIRAPAPVAVHRDLAEADDQRIARLRTFDEKRSREGVRRARLHGPVLIAAARIERFGGDDLARLDSGEHRMRARKRVVVGLGDDGLRLAGRSRLTGNAETDRRARQRPLNSSSRHASLRV